MKIKTLSVFAVLLFSMGILKAQTTDALGTYTPYSLFGIGDIERQGTALNRGMGGIGVGMRDNRFINYLNPAAITERDTLAFMLDFGVDQKNYYNTDGRASSAYNTFNMRNIILTAPIYKKSALIIGISPYSNIGYKFESTEMNNALVAQYGDIKYQQYGEGSINQFFIGGAVNLFKNFSLGAEFIYYFGALDRYSSVLFNSDPSARSLKTGWDYALSSISGRVGLQYFGRFGKKKGMTFTAGATYRLKTDLKGELNRFAYASDASGIDTVRAEINNNARLSIPAELAFGVSLRKRDKWLVGFDYMRQDWNGTRFIEKAEGFTPVAQNSYKLGFEFIPNKYDIRYYMKRVSYRVGAYFDQSYIKMGNRQVNSAGLTLGMSLPIYRGNNAMNLAVDFGQRGSVKGPGVRERYVQFFINISLHDVWFVKHKYD